jgi:hypothetical protein
VAPPRAAGHPLHRLQREAHPRGGRRARRRRLRDEARVAVVASAAGRRAGA